MSKQIGYREFCEYVAYNDDVTEIEENEEFPPTILMSAICHLYDKEWIDVRKYLLKLVAKIEAER